MNLFKNSLPPNELLVENSLGKNNLSIGITWPRNPDNPFLSMEALNLEAKNCQKCNLCQTRNNVVVYDGNPKAKLMIVGEGPGEQEDLKGLPFVGKAGILLDKMLDAGQISRKEETYIANIVKCRPPSNRVPKPIEVEQCWPYLQSQIYLVKPKILLLLGATSVAGVLKIKNPKITKLHGEWIDGQGELLEGTLIMPFYHPSYLLRNQRKEVGSPKWQACESIKKVREKLNEILRS